ncbi:hypothetical protein [Collinsella stercoris]|uniref:hypothetical protein n=1 Tax=Collinsella stercoris TaxID=147206 RepID=UPI00248DC143|nr:hypothetical protein [Collinsella stercoris]
MRRALKLIALAVLMLAICRATSAIHDAKVSADLARIWEQREAQRLEAVQAIRETEDADLKRLGLTD